MTLRLHTTCETRKIECPITSNDPPVKLKLPFLQGRSKSIVSPGCEDSNNAAIASIASVQLWSSHNIINELVIEAEREMPVELLLHDIRDSASCHPPRPLVV